jgi:archaellum component FlaD/FlaE
VSVKTYDDQIAQENDHLKREVKKLKLKVNKLKKQAKVQPSQDNCSNVLKKIEKEKIAPKIASQPPKEQVQNEKDEKIEYARSVFLNARRSHIKSGIEYKSYHNSASVKVIASRSHLLRRTSVKVIASRSHPLRRMSVKVIASHSHPLRRTRSTTIVKVKSLF